MSGSADLARRPVAAGASGVGADPTGSTRFSGASLTVLLLAVLTVAARLPSTFRPLSPDEGGFLMVAAQWGRGRSLYGDYWVDRPPLLITLFRVAHLIGDGPGLRLLGDACVAASVLLAAALATTVARLDGRQVRTSRVAAICAAATAAALLVSPSFGAGEVDGELLAVPFVLAGLTAALIAHGGARGAGWWWAAAGALGVAAASVKQNVLEVFVGVAVLLLVQTRRSARRALGATAAFAAGVLGFGLLLLGWSALHGTTPSGLWDAVVSFRLEASALIAQARPATADRRALWVAGAFVVSGSLGLVLVALLPRRRGRGPRPSALVLVITIAVLGWEAIGVTAGGSYWLHYLIGTVPGLVLASAAGALSSHGRRVALGVVLGWVGALAAAGVVVTTVRPIDTSAPDLAVEHYLATHSRAGDTATVAFGDPALLQAAHLASPYPQLWSLPVRVRDPRLSEFTAILTGPDRPTWVVVDGASLGTWGVDDSLAQPVLEREYELVRTDGDWNVYHLRTAADPLLSKRR